MSNGGGKGYVDVEGPADGMSGETILAARGEEQVVIPSADVCLPQGSSTA